MCTLGTAYLFNTSVIHEKNQGLLENFHFNFNKNIVNDSYAHPLRLNKDLIGQHASHICKFDIQCAYIRYS